MTTTGDVGVGIPGEEEGDGKPDIVRFFGTGATPECRRGTKCVENPEVLLWKEKREVWDKAIVLEL